MHFHNTNNLQTPASSLRNIINQSRIPLNHYVRQKNQVNKSPHSYFDKLKKMINNSNQYSYKKTKTETINKQKNEKKMTHQNLYARNKLPELFHGDMHFHTEMNTINQQEWSPEQNNITPKHHKSRSMFGNVEKEQNLNKCCSTLGNDKDSSNKKIHRISRSRRKNNNKDQVQKIKAQLLQRQRIPSNKSYSTFTNKEKRQQVINYKTYEIISESDSSKTYQWGKMLLKDVLGTGAHACVRLGISQNIKFAVKIYQKYKLLEPRRKKRVYTQISILKKIPEHSNIITLVESFEDKKQIHMIFQHIGNAMTLHQYFRGRMLFLNERELKDIFHRILRGVAHLHENKVAHRDIKPDNILIGYDEDGKMILKIIDLGFAISSSKADLHCGTPNFMAPQLLQKSYKYDPFAVDIWALGITLFYLIEGRYPFRGYDEKDLFRAIRKGQYSIKKTEQPKLLEIFERTLNINPSERITIKQLMKHQWFFQK